jgi:hypothetical protein
MPLVTAQWLPYASLLAVFGGWFVANWQANRREDRKEARGLLDHAKRLAVQVADDALCYLCEGNVALAPRITSNLDLVEIELQRLPKFGAKGCPLLAALVAFQDATTGGDFETANPEQRPRQSAEAVTVLRTRNALLGAMEQHFVKHYC